MNRINNWQETLRLANEDLKPHGSSIAVNDEVGFYNIEIITGNETIVFAENYFEDELAATINEAYHVALARAQEKEYVDFDKPFTVVTIDRNMLRACGYDYCVSDETMIKIAKEMEDWFYDELYVEAIQECAGKAGVKRLEE